MATDEGNAIRAQGAAAFANGYRLGDNPYGQSTGYRSFSWAAGWRAARTAKMKNRPSPLSDREG